MLKLKKGWFEHVTSMGFICLELDTNSNHVHISPPQSPRQEPWLSYKPDICVYLTDEKRMLLIMNTIIFVLHFGGVKYGI